MDSFTVFDYLPTFAKELETECVSMRFKDISFIEMAKSAESNIKIHSGEMCHWDRIAEEFLQEIDRKGNDFSVELFCGRWVYTESEKIKNDEHPLLNNLVRGLYNRVKTDKNERISFTFNDVNILEQVEFGYLHCIIIDDKTTYVEQPHGYPKFDEDYDVRKWLYVPDCPVFANEIIKRADVYLKTVGLNKENVSDTIRQMSMNTFEKSLFFAKTKDINFSNYKRYREVYSKFAM